MIFTIINNYYPKMTNNLNQELETYRMLETMSVFETMNLFEGGLSTAILDSSVSDDLKKDFEKSYRDLCDTDEWQEWDDDCAIEYQKIVTTFYLVIDKIIEVL